MTAAICDDDRLWCETAEAIIRAYADGQKIELELCSYQSGTELMERMDRTPDVLFLDIKLENESGIDIAQMVNERWKNCLIIYLTDYLYFATDVYHTEHVYFVLKNQLQERIDSVFQKVLQTRSLHEKKLVFSLNRGKEILFAPAEILYFERLGRLTEAVTVKGTYQIKESLNEIQQCLPDIGFVRCHNSYIVHLAAVTEKRADSFVLKNGETVAISRGYKNKAAEAFLKWAQTQI